jgi:hypothetical protein
MTTQQPTTLDRACARFRELAGDLRTMQVELAHLAAELRPTDPNPDLIEDWPEDRPDVEAWWSAHSLADASRRGDLARAIATLERGAGGEA